MTGPEERFDDAALRTAFADLRRDEAERAPAFASTWSRARRVRARRRARSGAAAVLVVATAAALFVTVRSLERTAAEGALAAELLASQGRWRGPTDFLLEGRSPPLWGSTRALRETLSNTRKPQ